MSDFCFFKIDFPYENMGEYENEMLRRKLHLVREENTKMVSQNHKLLSQLEAMGHQLHQANTKVNGLMRHYYSTSIKLACPLVFNFDLIVILCKHLCE